MLRNGYRMQIATYFVFAGMNILGPPGFTGEKVVSFIDSLSNDIGGISDHATCKLTDNSSDLKVSW